MVGPADEFSIPPATVEPVNAPAWPAYAATAAASVAVFCVPLAADGLRVGIVGYVVGALLVPALTVVHRFGRQRAAKNPFYVPRPTTERLLLIVLGVGLVAGVANAWFVATELAKR